MLCPDCGQSYGLTHNCAGVAPAQTFEEASPPSHSIPVVHYFLEGWRIARWDEAAIRRASKDGQALLFGLLFWGLSFLTLAAVPTLRQVAVETRINWLVLLFSLVIFTALAIAVTLAQYAVCHFIARQFFHAKGTYLGVLRPLLLGSIVNFLFVIPVFGLLAAGIWDLAILMFVFEEVEGIERMQAFGISFVVGIAFQLLLGTLTRGL